MIRTNVFYVLFLYVATYALVQAGNVGIKKKLCDPKIAPDELKEIEQDFKTYEDCFDKELVSLNFKLWSLFNAIDSSLMSRRSSQSASRKKWRRILQRISLRNGRWSVKSLQRFSSRSKRFMTAKTTSWKRKTRPLLLKRGSLQWWWVFFTKILREPQPFMPRNASDSRWNNGSINGATRKRPQKTSRNWKIIQIIMKRWVSAWTRRT